MVVIIYAFFLLYQDKLKEREREMRKRKEREEQEMERVRLKVRRKEAVASYQALLVETIKDAKVVFDSVYSFDGLLNFITYHEIFAGS